MNFASDLKTAIVFVLFIISAWLLLSLPRRLKREREKLNELRSDLGSQLIEMIGLYSKAPENFSGRSTLIHQEEMADYDGRVVSGMSWRVISRDPNEKYWFHTIYSPKRTALIEPIDEVRARRALFNKPEAYQAAFSELPDRKRFAASFVPGVVSERDSV